MLQKVQTTAIAKSAHLLSRPIGWVSAFLGITLFLALSIGTAGVVDSKQLIWAISGLLGFLFTAIARNLIQPPVFPRKTIGILLAIKADSDESQSRLENDLAQALLDSLQEANTSLPIEVKVLQQFHAPNVIDVESATDYAKITGARFVIFGSLTKRKVKAEDHYVLHVKSLVTHTPTTIQNQSTLSQEMAVVLPNKANIAASDDFDGLEITGHLFGLGSQYVIAVAMFISGDRSTSIAVLKNLNRKLKTARLPRDWPGSRTIINLAPKRLLDFQFGEIDHEYFQWRTDHDSNRLRLIDARFSQLPETWKKDGRYLNIRAICHFVLTKNVGAARQLIQRVGSVSPESIVWRYSLAFLDAYEEKIPEARAAYLRAFRFDDTSEIALEVEVFVSWITEIDRTKEYLLFFLGFINFHKKKDFSSAVKDFQKFLSAPSSSKFPQLADEARLLIKQCATET